MYPEIKTYLSEREAEFDKISASRRIDLESLAHYVRKRLDAEKAARLLFVCTHNSRRSHFAQIWAAVAAHHVDLKNVKTFSGGTETTAFNPRAVSALNRVGFKISKDDHEKNPVYQVRFSDSAKPQVCFSKVYQAEPNPTSEFAVVMTCTQADQGCPLVAGAEFRLALPYDDPKSADDTPAEQARYDERCAQIAREMLYMMVKAKPPIATGK